MEARTSSSLSSILGGTAIFVGAAGLLALLVPAFYEKRVAELKAERGWAATPLETNQTKSAQASRLKSYGWIDRTNGVVALPIERAMELVVAESAGVNGGEVKK
ncbi:MAG: hypothetical protein HZA52_11365 [Planctomycetes bacterium]|nr:hypothetical protein [Planctomycetota bacterium]